MTPTRRDKIEQFISQCVNVATGGVWGEYYCDRLYREGKIDQLYYINWLLFYTLRDADHYERLKRRMKVEEWKNQ